MKSKLYPLDYLIVISVFIIILLFTMQVNKHFENDFVIKAYPSTITLELKEDKEVIVSLIEGLKLSEDKKYLEAYIYDINKHTEEEATIIIKAELSEKDGVFKLKSKDVKKGSDFILETELHYLNGKIVNIEIGEPYAK